MILPLGPFFNPLAKQFDLLGRKRRGVIRHSCVRVRRRYPTNQFRFIRMTGHDRSPSRLASAQGFLAENKRHAIFLAYTAVTLHAVLIQNRLNIITEAHGSMKHLLSEPCSQSGTSEDDCNKHHDTSLSTGWGWGVEHTAISISSMWPEPERINTKKISPAQGFDRGKPRAN